MIKIPNEVLATYMDGEFIIEVCQEEVQGHDSYCAYLRRKDYGTKFSVPGVAVGDCSFEDYTEMVENLLPQYEEYYDEEVF